MPRRYPSVARNELKSRARDGLHRISEVLKEKLHVATAGDVEDSFRAGQSSYDLAFCKQSTDIAEF